MIGTAFFENIPKDLVDEILSQDCNVKYLSLGKYGTYYCLFDNGQVQWNGEIDESLDRLFQSGITRLFTNYYCPLLIIHCSRRKNKIRLVR